MIRRIVWFSVWPCALVLLGACAGAPSADKGGVGAASVAGEAPEHVATKPVPPRVENKTPFPHLTLTGVDKFGEYASFALKMTYAIDEQGRLQLQRGDQEPLIDEQSPVEEDYRCKSHGAGFNQRTTWFPDAAILVHGATLTGLKDGLGQRKPLAPMVEGDRGIVAVTGPQARETEYAYVPCVGAHRARAPVRTVGYVAPGDQLTLRVPAAGRKRSASPEFVLSMPQDFRPVVVLDFANRGQRAVVPARIVLLTVDWPARRAVAQYQATVAMQPQVALAVWSTTFPPDLVKGQDATFQEVNNAMRRYIQSCGEPIKPMDPCANPHGDLPPALRR